MSIATNITLVDFISSDSDAKREFDLRSQWPWLKHISDDGHTWLIADGQGEKRESAEVSINIELMDGSNLADRKNLSLYSLVVEYSEVYRLHNPLVTAAVHIQRIKALLAFVCWLSEYRIRSLEKVTKAHIESYTEHIAYGYEAALKVPNRVFTAVKRAILKGESLPIKSGYFVRRDTYSLAGINHSGSTKRHSSYPHASAMLSWFEACIRKDFQGYDLEKIEYQDLLEDLNLFPERRTISTIHRNLLPIDEIWQWHRHLHSANIRFNPFPEGVTKASSRLGKENKRTKSIPPKVAFEFLAEATKWVLDYSETIVSLYQSSASADSVEASLLELGIDIKVEDGNWFFASKKRDSVTLEGIVRILSAACFAVIASLTARRKEEIFDLGHDCIDEDRGDGAYWLTIYIEKTSRRYDLCPVPALVKKAVNVLENISASARKLTGRDTLWEYVTVDGKVSSFAITGSLQNLYDHFVISRTDVEWNFSPHQFRRFFALIYYYRYEGAAIGPLSYHMRHFNLEMTRKYITDTDFHKEMKDVGEEWTALFLRQILSGKRKVGGRGGEKIKKKLQDWVDHFRGRVDVVERERVVQKMLRYMKRVGSTFTQHVWGTTCSCPVDTSLAALAHCRNQDGKPDFSNGTEELCGGCPFSIHEERYSSGVAKSLRSIDNTRKVCRKNSILNELSGVKISSLNLMLERAEAIEVLDLKGHE